MNCPDAETIVRYVEHETRADERQIVADHLDSCEACRQVVALAATSLFPSADSDERGGATRIVGRYRVHRLLDAGGMGLVYEAEDPKLGRRVALKMLHQGRVRRRELRREARAIASLDHPAVIKIYDVGRIDERDFIVMELVHGGTLREWLRSQRRSRAEVLDAFASIASGLSAVHRLGVVHRDFKPANVLVRTDGTFVITDFGLSATGRSQSTPQTHADPGALDTSSGVVGTPAYMAPEQRQGGLATARSDQYSFAVSLVEALTGDKDGLESPSISRRVRRVLRRGLSQEPADRFRSVEALWHALARADAPVGRRVAAVVAGTALVGVAGLFGYTTFASDNSCDDAVKSAHRSLMRGVAAAGAAQDADPAFVGTADSQLEKWRQEARANCRLTAQERDQQARCLDRERHRFEVVLAGLAQRGPGAWDQWRASVDLVDFERCRDVGDPSSEGDPELLALIDEAEVYAVRSEYLSALEILETVVDRARAGADPALPRALHARGATYWQLDDYDAAFRDGSEAHRQAAELGQDVEIVRAAVLLANVSFTRGHDDADRWLAAADAAVTRIGDRPDLGAIVAQAHARVAYSNREFQEAINHAKRGLAMLPAETDRTDRTNLLSVSAWAYLDLVKYDDAHKAASEAAQILEEHRGVHNSQYIEMLRLMAQIASQQGHYDEAIELQQRARTLLLEIDNAPPSMLFKARLTLASAYRDRGRHDEAIEECLAILASAEKWDLTQQQRSMVHGTLGWAYITSEQAELALPHVDRAIVLSESHGSRTSDYGLLLAEKGDALRALRRIEEATRAFDEAIEVLDDTLGPRSPKAAWVRQLRAGARIKLEPERSRGELLDVIEIFTESMGPESPALTGALTDLCEAELALGNKEAAKAHLRRAIAIAPSDDPDHPLLKQMQTRLAEID